jgi:hypothetical protein
MSDTSSTTGATGFADVGALFGAHLDGEAKARLEADSGRLVIAFGTAVLFAQLFEFFARIAAPALMAPVDNEEVAEATVTEGLERGLSAALQVLRPAADGVAVPEGLHERLDDARLRRNALAHGFSLPFVLRLMTGEVDVLIEALEADTVAFQGVLNELAELTCGPALAARGVTPEIFEQAIVGLMLTAARQPDLLDGVERLQDFDIVLERMKDRLDDSGQVGDGEAAEP